MLDAVLHVATDQPAVGWILVASLLSFVAGLGLGLGSDRLREWFGLRRAESADEPTN